MRLTRSEAIIRRRKMRQYSALVNELKVPQARTFRNWYSKEMKRVENRIARK